MAKRSAQVAAALEDSAAGSGDNARIGAQLKAARLARRKTLAEIALESGLTKGFVSKLERDQATASVASLMRLCEALAIPVGSLFHASTGEIVRRNDEPVGYVRAASYGFTLGGAVGLVMVEAGEPVNRAYVADAKWDVEIANTRYPAVASIRPLYDPTMERIKS